MVDQEILSKRLRVLEELEAKLARFATVAEQEFLAQDALHDLAEHYLHQAVECMADIANHVLADRGLTSPETYRGVFIRLAEAGVISTELGGRLTGWAGFRNLLVHMYLDIDHRVSWRAIKEDLGDLLEFRRVLAHLLAGS